MNIHYKYIWLIIFIPILTKFTSVPLNSQKRDISLLKCRKINRIYKKSLKGKNIRSCKKRGYLIDTFNSIYSKNRKIIPVKCMSKLCSSIIYVYEKKHDHTVPSDISVDNAKEYLNRQKEPTDFKFPHEVRNYIFHRDRYKNKNNKDGFNEHNDIENFVGEEKQEKSFKAKINEISFIKLKEMKLSFNVYEFDSLYLLIDSASTQIKKELELITSKPYSINQIIFAKGSINDDRNHQNSLNYDDFLSTEIERSITYYKDFEVKRKTRRLAVAKHTSHRVDYFEYWAFIMENIDSCVRKRIQIPCPTSFNFSRKIKENNLEILIQFTIKE